MCHLQVVPAAGESRQAWVAKNQELVGRVLWIVRRDPGRRPLATVNCRRKHWLRARLRSVFEDDLVDFWRF